MNTTEITGIMQRWNTIQYELIPSLGLETEPLTPKLVDVVHTLEWIRIDDLVGSTWTGIGRPPHDRAALASAFVAKSILRLDTTKALIERLTIDRALRRICGFPRWKKIPTESTFSRAFDEFSQSKLAEMLHELLVKEHLGDKLIGHISRDGTAIVAREKPVYMSEVVEPVVPRKAPAGLIVTEPAPTAQQEVAPVKAKQGRPRKDEIRLPKLTKIQQQINQTLPKIMAELPRQCDKGTKSNAQGYKDSWNGYKLHLDTADCGVVISVLITSASVHDSQTAIPLAMMTAERVTNLYDLMDAAYCSKEIRDHSRSLNHVPLIDHNPRGGEKIDFLPHEAERYKERSQAERSNARIKDEFGGRNIWVKGATKVMSHLMFGVLALTVNQLTRLLV